MFRSLIETMAAVTIFAIGLAPNLLAQQNSSLTSGLEILQLQPNFYMIAGAGANLAVQTGPDGVVLVDSGSAQTADAVLDAVKKVSGQPIRYIINTGMEADRVGGNEKLAAAGESISWGLLSSTSDDVSNNRDVRASIVGPQKLLNRMSEPVKGQTGFSANSWPTESFARKEKDIYLNHEGIQIFYQPAARTDTDSIVFFRRSDVIVTGDIFDNTRFPMLDVERGGTIQGEIDALNRIISLAIPVFPLRWREGGTQVIPGHGRICLQFDVVEYRDMVTIIRDRVQDMINRGMTLQQVQAAAPAQGYTRRYGADSGPWTTSMFIEAVYKSLKTSTKP